MLRTCLQGAAGLVLSSFLVVPSGATCQIADNCWTATVTMTVWTGTPTVICPIGHPVVRVESSSECGPHAAGPTVALRCGTSSTAVVYSGAHGSTHTLTPTSSWETALSSGCASLDYEAH